ncbi:MAG: RIP metalloprotease RseP, partial [Nitratireductor sp.]
VVFIHELGHFMVARWNKVDIDVFAVGFGKELFGFNDKHGTRWKFCLIPLGGYVKFAGDANGASMPDPEVTKNMSAQQIEGSFAHKRLGQKAAIVAAGPIANFILAAIIFAGLAMTVGRFVSEPRITGIVEGGAAQSAGFMVGDIIKTVDGVEIESFTDIPPLVIPNPGRPMIFEVTRDGMIKALTVTPKMIEREDQFGNLETMGTIGVMSNVPREESKIVVSTPLEAIVIGIKRPWEIISTTVVFLKDVITGQHSVKRLGGPIRIAKASGQIATLGVIALISWTAFLSVSIGFLNLLPIPPLDGGHLMFYAIEKLKGSPLSEGAQEVFFKVGFLFVLCFMLFVTFNDVMKEFIGV